MHVAFEAPARHDLSDVARNDNIARALARAVRKRPQRTALSFGERAWTYARLERAVGGVAARLHALGLQRGERVAAYGRNSDAYVLLWLACARGGFVHVPINYALTAAELDYIIAQSRSAALVYDADLTSVVTAAKGAASVGVRGRFVGPGETLDVLAAADGEPAHEPADSPTAADLVQLL